MKTELDFYQLPIRCSHHHAPHRIFIKLIWLRNLLPLHLIILPMLSFLLHLLLLNLWSLVLPSGHCHPPPPPPPHLILFDLPSLSYTYYSVRHKKRAVPEKHAVFCICCIFSKYYTILLNLCRIMHLHQVYWKKFQSTLMGLANHTFVFNVWLFFKLFYLFLNTGKNS